MEGRESQVGSEEGRGAGIVVTHKHPECRCSKRVTMRMAVAYLPAEAAGVLATKALSVWLR